MQAFVQAPKISIQNEELDKEEVVEEAAAAEEALKDEVEEDIEELERKAVVANLDRVSRVAFPVAFVLCNAVYWPFYLVIMAND